MLFFYYYLSSSRNGSKEANVTAEELALLAKHTKYNLGARRVKTPYLWKNPIFSIKGEDFYGKIKVLFVNQNTAPNRKHVLH